MDSAERRVRVAILDYLDEVGSTQHRKISDETEDALRSAAEGLGVRPGENLSPGMKAAAEASGEFAAQVVTAPEDELSPGQQEVLNANPGGTS